MGWDGGIVEVEIICTVPVAVVVAVMVCEKKLTVKGVCCRSEFWKGKGKGKKLARRDGG